MKQSLLNWPFPRYQTRTKYAPYLIGLIRATIIDRSHFAICTHLRICIAGAILIEP